MSSISTMNKFQIEDLFQLAIEFVKSYPEASEKCRRLQTFVCLQSLDDFNSENLSRSIYDTNKPFFWSRKWERSGYSPEHLDFEYPALSFFIRPIQGSDLLKKSNRICYELEVAVLDKYREDCLKPGSNCGECGKRTKNEIYLSAEKMIRTFYAYLRDIVYVKSEENSGWYNKSIWEFLELDGSIDEDVSRLFKKQMLKDNPSTTMRQWSGGKDNLYGMWAPLKICGNFCLENDYYLHNEIFDLRHRYGNIKISDQEVESFISLEAGESIVTHKPIAAVGGKAYIYNASNPEHINAFAGFSITSGKAGDEINIQRDGIIDMPTLLIEGESYMAGSNGSLVQSITNEVFRKLIAQAVTSSKILILHEDGILI